MKEEIKRSETKKFDFLNKWMEIFQYKINIQYNFLIGEKKFLYT
jgi:hypothetical protein